MTHGDIPVTAGLTVRDYFAARAPRKIADWFSPKMPPKPGDPPFDAFPEDSPMARLCGAYRKDPDYDTESAIADLRARGDITKAQAEEVLAYTKEYERCWEVLHAWRCMREDQLAAQWPWAWADMVLATREVTRS